MTKDNVTGKNKDFYDLGKKIFDRLNPQGAINPKVVEQREWQGLTDAEYEAMAEQYVTNCYFDTLKYAKAIEAKLREKNG